MRTWLARLAYGAFLLLFVELALQGFYYLTAGGLLFWRVAPPIWAPDPDAVFWNKANLHVAQNTNEFRTKLYTNSRGFRVSEAHEEYAVPKPGDRVRALLLGPSFAYGWGVNFEDSFGTRLRTLLEQGGYAGARPLELINAGVPSLGAHAQLRWFRRHAPALAPDLVIQLVYGSMALRDRDPYDVDERGYLLPRQRSFAHRVRAEVKKSAIVFYGWILATRLRDLASAPEAGTTIQGAGRALELHGAFDPGAPEVVESLRFYDELRGAVEGLGARLVVVYFPLAYCIHPEDVRRWQHLGVRDVERQMAFDAAFCGFLAERGVRCLDITPELQRAAREDGKRLYYWLDIHWTPEGHRVAASAVARRMLDEGR
jgi:hypothetical protein